MEFNVFSVTYYTHNKHPKEQQSTGSTAGVPHSWSSPFVISLTYEIRVLCHIMWLSETWLWYNKWFDIHVIFILSVLTNTNKRKCNIFIFRSLTLLNLMNFSYINFVANVRIWSFLWIIVHGVCICVYVHLIFSLCNHNWMTSRLIPHPSNREDMCYKHGSSNDHSLIDWIEFLWIHPL